MEASLPEKARQFMTRQDWVVLDTETTGKETWSAEIVEISIIDHQGVPLLNTLVYPTCPISEDATRIHGITNEMVIDAPGFLEVFPKIVQAIKDKVVVIYNAEFDATLLRNQSKRNDLELSIEPWCLMKAYADYRKTPGRYGNYKWHRLGEACEQQRVTLTDAHRALGDTLATWALLHKLAEVEA